MRPRNLKNERVAVLVATYNSAPFVVETLESIRNQTHQELELIVTDDASTDATVDVVKSWIDNPTNSQRFVRVEFVTASINTGVSANCNRALRAASAQWIKLIAGDDILLPDCIKDNMTFLSENENAKVVFSRVRNYLDNFLKQSYISTTPVVSPFFCTDNEFTAEDQYKILLLSDRINYSPSNFFYKDAVLGVGGYDESNRLVEDYPMWLKLTKAGYRFYFMEKETVGYRRHHHATVNTGKAHLINPMTFRLKKFRYEHVYPYLPWDIALSEKFTIAIAQCFQKINANRNTQFLRALYQFLTVYLNPFRYIIFAKKKIFRMGDTNIFYRY